MRFKIDWAGLIVGSKFTVFALFYHVFEGNFPSTAPGGLYFTGLGGLYLEELIHGGAYFRNFTVCGAVFFIFQRYQEILTSKLSSVGVFGVVFFVPHYSEKANFLFLF